MIYAGNLTETLKFYEVVETQSSSGYKQEEQEYRFTCKAQRMKNKENLVEDASELFHISNLTFRLRKRKFDETYIVVYRNESYRILSIDEWRNEQTIIIQKIND